MRHLHLSEGCIFFSLENDTYFGAEFREHVMGAHAVEIILENSFVKYTTALIIIGSFVACEQSDRTT
jgi:hypothetical protein